MSFSRWMCSISEKIGVKVFDIIMERQRPQTGSVKCFSHDEIIKICTTMLESELVSIVLLALSFSPKLDYTKITFGGH